MDDLRAAGLSSLVTLLAFLTESAAAAEEFDEFVKYCEAKERVLRRVFDAIDQEKDGKLHREEVRAALDMLEIAATDAEVCGEAAVVARRSTAGQALLEALIFGFLCPHTLS